MQNKFNSNEYKKALNYDFTVNWDNPLKQSSEELGTEYYEFPIIFTSKFNPDEIYKNKPKKSKYYIGYKLIVTENEKQEYKYYILRFYQENYEETKNLDMSLASSESFTGIIHLLNSNGDIVFAKKLVEGIENNKKFYNFKKQRHEEENLQSREDEDCTTETTYYYTDNYVRWGDGPAVYVSSTLTGYTTTTTCSSPWLPNLDTTGGGGGLYNSSGSGGVYNNCSGVECKYKIDNVEVVTVLAAPDSPIDNMENYLNCFDTTKPAQLTIYVDQPIANQNDSWTSGNGKAGHAFISITQGNLTRSWGLYPEGDANPFNSNDPHAFGNNSQDEFDVSITVIINHASLLNIIEDTENYNLNYDLNTNNCTDYVIQTAGLAGITLPDPQSTWPGGGGSNPGAFGQELRTMNLTNGMTRNETTGTANQNASPSNCN